MAGSIQTTQLPPGRVPIAYSPKYNISFLKLESLHPFDSKKYLRVYEFLVRWGLVKPDQFFDVDRKPTTEELLTVHTHEYLTLLNTSSAVARYTEMPFVALFPQCLVRSRVLEPMLYATMGTLMAAELAIQNGWAINLGGGFHHACSNCGGGFCIYSDIPMAVRRVRSLGLARRVMIVDLDAHQGNGHERDLAGDIEKFTVDLFNRDIYPGDVVAQQGGIDLAVMLQSGTDDTVYLSELQSALQAAFTQFSAPDLLIYNAGTDILEGDPLGLMNVSAKAVMERDRMVFEAAISRGVPVLMVLSGGYQRSNAHVIASSIQNLNTHFGLLQAAAAQRRPTVTAGPAATAPVAPAAAPAAAADSS